MVILRGGDSHRVRQGREVEGSGDLSQPIGEGEPRAKGRRRSRLPALLASVVVLVLLALVALAVILFSARSALLTGLGEMRAAQSRLGAIAQGQSAYSELGPARDDVVRAHHDFHAADSSLSPVAPVLQHLGWVPDVGGDLTAAAPGARLADETSAGVVPLLTGLQPILATWRPGAGGGHATIPRLVARVAAGRPQFERAQLALQRAETTRRALGAPTGSLGHALHGLDRELPRLVMLSRSLVLLPNLLGYPGARNYLVAYQNSAELRATGGFIGSIGILKVHDGRTSQHFQGTGIQDQLALPPPEPVHLYNGERWWLLRDANWSPDFPTTAQLEQYFMRLDLHRAVSGVLNITPAAASEILQATGPLYSPEYRRWITAGNVAALADYYTHWTSHPGPHQYASPDTTRKQFILIVAKHVLARLAGLTPAQWLRMGTAIGAGISHGDILLYFPNGPEEALVSAAGASGAINPTTADYLYVVDTNLSYNKISPFVQVRDRYGVRIRPDRWLDARLWVTIKDGPVPADFRLHGIGPGAGAYGGPLDYADFLRVYAPAGAQLVDQSGWTQPWSPGPAYGKTEFSGYLIVKNGATRTVYLHYVVPPNVFSWSGGHRYRLLIPHQPGSHPDAITVSVRDGQRRWGWSLTHPTVAWSRTVAITDRPFHPVPLPRPPGEVVAPGHWIEPHAFLATPQPGTS